MQARSKEGVRYGISAVVEGLKIVWKGLVGGRSSAPSRADASGVHNSRWWSFII